jgi:hypothetical protein
MNDDEKARLAVGLNAGRLVDVRTRVLVAMAQASYNGYDFDGWDSREIAADMLIYDADLEGLPVEAVLPYVKEWRRR